MAGYQAYQPVQPIDVAGLFGTIAALRNARLNEEQNRLQLADLYEARDRRHQIQAALQKGDMQAYAALDPHGYAQMQRAGLESLKTQAEIADKQSLIDDRARTADKERADATTKAQANISRALEANPSAAPQLQQQVDAMAQRGTINHFVLPGHEEQMSPGVEGPPSYVQPTRQEIATLQRGAGIEDPYDKPTTDMINFQAATGLDPRDPKSGPAFERYQLSLRQAGSGQAPVTLAQNLRKEFDALPEVKNYSVVRSALANIKSASANGVGDLSTIFAYMKLLDPNSSVREGEAAAASNAGGVPESIRALWNKALGQGSLTEPLRKQFIAEATRIEQQQRKFYDRAASNYRRMAQANGLNPNDVVINLDEQNPDEPGAGNANTHVIGFRQAPAGGVSPDGRTIDFNQAPQPGAVPVSRAQAASEFDQLVGGGR